MRECIHPYTRDAVPLCLWAIHYKYWHLVFRLLLIPLMSAFTIHPLLAYSQPQTLPGYVTPLIWDLRQSPDDARHVANPESSLTFAALAQDATTPALDTINITCGIFPADWPITVHRPEGINVGDVLEAIYAAVQRRISHQEWEQLSPKEQEQIRLVFEERCTQAPVYDDAHNNGVLRVDCLQQHIFFAGLSISLEADQTCILTLRRVTPRR